jgi:hypothetical protein
VVQIFYRKFLFFRSLQFLHLSQKISFALSHAPPALFWKIAQSTPLTVTPAMYAPKASAPNDDTYHGDRRQDSDRHPAANISRKAAFVEISTHFPYSGCAGAFQNTRNFAELSCALRSTMSMAALPTLLIAIGREHHRNHTPNKQSEANTGALKILIPSMPVSVT